MPNDTGQAALAASVEEPRRCPTADHPAAMLTTVEAAEVLGLSPRTLEQLRGTGAGPEYFALGRRAIRYQRRDLDRWLAARRRKSTSDPGPSEPE